MSHYRKCICCQCVHASRALKGVLIPHLTFQWNHTLIHREEGRRNCEFPARLASVGVCFRSCMYTSVIRSDFNRLQLLTIHSFMNHDSYWPLTQGSASSSSVPLIHRKLSTLGARIGAKTTMLHLRYGLLETVTRGSMIMWQWEPKVFYDSKLVILSKSVF